MLFPHHLSLSTHLDEIFPYKMISTLLAVRLRLFPVQKFHPNIEKVIYLNVPSTNCNEAPRWVKELISNLGILIALFRVTKMQSDVLITKKGSVEFPLLADDCVYAEHLYCTSAFRYDGVRLYLICWVKCIHANPYLSRWQSQRQQRGNDGAVYARWMGILLLSAYEAGWISDS